MLSITHAAALTRCMLFELEDLKELDRKNSELNLRGDIKRAEEILVALRHNDKAFFVRSSFAFNHLHKVATLFEPYAAIAFAEDMRSSFGIIPDWQNRPWNQKPSEYALKIRADRLERYRKFKS